MTSPPADFVVDFPTLGFLAADWIAQHCPIPDGFAKGEPFEMYDWQLWCTCNHYRVKDDALWVPERPILAPAFFYRRSQVVAPQKIGKGPWSATIVCHEARGPAVFAGWARGGEVYDCRDHSCDCGWTFDYEPGDPMGIPWPTPLIQCMATSQEQVDNVWRPLQSMVKNGPLAEQINIGEVTARIGEDGYIESVTASALSRLGNPIIFALQDETGLYNKTNKLRKVAETQRRGAAGMGGRSMETTNAWDPAEDSVAQTTSESQRPDIFRYHRKPPADLSYRNKRDRRKIHELVYAGSAHINLDSIEADAAELLEHDPTQAERFYGNRVVVGGGSWLADGLWASRQRELIVPAGTAVCAGFDGSDLDDWTAIRLETLDGHRFTPTYGPDNRPTIWNPREWPGESIPRAEVHTAWGEIVERYALKRAYCDPRDWHSEIGEWALQWGEEVFLEWSTYRIVQMHDALNRIVVDLRHERTTHDTCRFAEAHVANARKLARPGERYILGKPSQNQKIDVAMADVLAHEAASDAREAGWGSSGDAYAYYA